MKKSDTVRKYGIYALLAGAFFVPIFVGAAQGFLYAAIACWILLLLMRDGGNVVKNPATLWVLAFSGLAVATIFFGEDPERSLSKIHRLLMLGVLFAVPGLAVDRSPVVRRLLLAFVCGATILALYDIVRIPSTWIYDWMHIDQDHMQGRTYKDHVLFLLYDKGNMRDPQFYTFALLILLTFFPVYKASSRNPMLVLIALNAAALVLHNKRGAWLSFMCVAGIMLLRSKPALSFLRSKKGLALALIGVVLFGVATKSRWEDLKDQFDPNHGGRLELWTKVFMPFMQDHPWGFGYRAPGHDDFKVYTTDLSFTVKNHLHNNMLQVAAELGWIGLAVWIGWMLTHLVLLFRGGAQTEDPEDTALARTGFLGLVALLINGCVEYNFGDGEIFMLFTLIMGLSVWCWKMKKLARATVS